MPVKGIGQGKMQMNIFRQTAEHICRIGKLALDLFPFLPIIGRNTLSQNEFNLQLLPYYCRPSCSPYY
jgi:hypothetical protein